jgi:hypothetical protein
VSGGSFNYLYLAEDPGSREDTDHMIFELEALAAEGVPGAALAAAETRIVRAQGRAEQEKSWAVPEDPLRSVWHDVEWWRSADYGRDQVVDGLAAYVNDRAEQPPIPVVYRNHRGEVATRNVRPLLVRFGSTEYHKKPQWLLEVWDCDKGAARTFALADCDFDGADW